MTDFGALCDGKSDDTTAIQAAVDAAQTTRGKVIIPHGVCVISSPIKLSAATIEIEGNTMDGSELRASPSAPSMRAIIVFSDVSPNGFFEFRNLTLNGNNKAEYGVVSASLSHSLFYRLQVHGTTTAGLSIGYGWDNDFVECEVSYNYGDGLRLSVNSNNVVNIRASKIFRNGGVGLRVYGGAAITISGCTLEENAKAAIYIRGTVAGALIEGSYFEANAKAGYRLMDQSSRTVHSDIIINGSARDTTLGYSYPSQGITVESNFFNSAAAQDGAVFAESITGLELNQNVAVPSIHQPLIGVPLSGRAARISARNNVSFSGIKELGPPGADGASLLADWSFDDAPQLNFFSLPVELNAANRHPSTYLPSLVSTSFNGSPAWRVPTSTEAPNIWQQRLDLSQVADLRGQLVYLAAWIKTAAPDTSVDFRISGLESPIDKEISSVGWTRVVIVARLPEAGIVKFGISKSSGSAIASFSRPVFAAVGAPYANFYRELYPAH